MVTGEESLLFVEASAVVLNAAFALCIAYGKRIGWVLGFVASLLGVALYAVAHTWAMTVLNGYYVLMAVYGWWSWGRDDTGLVRTQHWTFHAVAVPIGLLLSYGISVLLGRFLNGHYPGLDAFVTVFSLLATWLMARKYYGNWAYFIVADAVGIYLNWRIGYFGYAALNGMYLVVSVIGLLNWRGQVRRQRNGPINAS